MDGPPSYPSKSKNQGPVTPARQRAVPAVSRDLGLDGHGDARYQRIGASGGPGLAGDR